jgi:alpha-D-xyloside xylohydrolase
VSDHFLIGADLLVVPVVKAGRREQEVRIPPGRWTSYSGEEIEGPRTITVQVKLDEVPYFQRVIDVQRVSDLN